LRIPIRRRAALLATFAALALSAILLASFCVSAAPHLPTVTKALPGPEDVVRVDRERRTPEYVDGEIIVKLRPVLRMTSGAEAAAEELRALSMELGAEIVDSTCVGPDAELFLVRIPVGMSVDEAVMTYEAQRSVEYAEPNYLWYPEAPVIPNDPHFWRLWGMRNYGQDFYPGVFWEKGIPGSDIGATEAWGVRTDASSVLVAVMMAEGSNPSRVVQGMPPATMPACTSWSISARMASSPMRICSPMMRVGMARSSAAV